MLHSGPHALLVRASAFGRSSTHVQSLARWKPSLILIRSIRNTSTHRLPHLILQKRLSFPRRTTKLLTYTVLLALALAIPLPYLLPNSQSRPPEPYPHLPISPNTFRPFTLSKSPISPTTALYSLSPPPPPPSTPDAYTALWPLGIWSISIAQPQLQITRAYTPLPPSPSQPTSALRLLIKHEPTGSVSPYLWSLRNGSSVLVRGPKVEFEIPGDVRDVLFLVGGTGIAAAMQGVEVLGRRGEGARVTVLWACRGREECVGGESGVGFGRRIAGWLWGATREGKAEKGLIVEQLEAMQARFPGRMEVECFVDEEQTFIGKRRIERFLREADADATARGKLVMVAGSEGFVGWISGEGGEGLWGARMMGGEGQEKLGGLLAQVNLGAWRVVRL